ncbi:hypothetical protein GCM10018781_57800 [Kitasatospora indigofera]|uniref:Uncharacterized protein n=1 Tax=Kitasatospora indigofera TaxID=67307 RepID=A0A919G7Q1_9ACTN|nr:hypothetical protein GCM10018781_57800 [Kitasatospora indigofera]
MPNRPAAATTASVARRYLTFLDPLFGRSLPVRPALGMRVPLHLEGPAVGGAGLAAMLLVTCAA